MILVFFFNVYANQTHVLDKESVVSGSGSGKIISNGFLIK